MLIGRVSIYSLAYFPIHSVSDGAGEEVEEVTDRRGRKA